MSTLTAYQQGYLDWPQARDIGHLSVDDITEYHAGQTDAEVDYNNDDGCSIGDRERN